MACVTFPEPDWKDFFESEKVQEKRKTVGFSRKDMVQGAEPQIYDQSGRIAVLPPIMYVDPEHPTLPGEAGLRLLHSIRWADKVGACDTSFTQFFKPLVQSNWRISKILKNGCIASI